MLITFKKILIIQFSFIFSHSVRASFGLLLSLNIFNSEQLSIICRLTHSKKKKKSLLLQTFCCKILNNTKLETRLFAIHYPQVSSLLSPKKWIISCWQNVVPDPKILNELGMFGCQSLSEGFCVKATLIGYAPSIFSTCFFFLEWMNSLLMIFNESKCHSVRWCHMSHQSMEHTGAAGWMVLGLSWLGVVANLEIQPPQDSLDEGCLASDWMCLDNTSLLGCTFRLLSPTAVSRKSFQAHVHLVTGMEHWFCKRYSERNSTFSPGDSGIQSFESWRKPCTGARTHVWPMMKSLPSLHVPVTTHFLQNFWASVVPWNILRHFSWFMCFWAVSTSWPLACTNSRMFSSLQKEVPPFMTTRVDLEDVIGRETSFVLFCFSKRMPLTK